MRLVTHLYSEHLLEQDQYLDWVIASFRDSDLDALPIWLLVMQIHEQDVHQHRQRGRRLAEGLLKHIDKVSRLCGSHKGAARIEPLVVISTSQPRIVRDSLEATHKTSHEYDAISPSLPHPSSLLEQV